MKRGLYILDNIYGEENVNENYTYSNMTSSSHTKWNCNYHIVFIPKYRRKIFYQKKRLEIGKILRSLCDWNEVRIIEAKVYPDYVYMFVSLPPKFSVSRFMGILKGKSSLMISQRWSNSLSSFGQRNFWCRGYYVDTSCKNESKILEYVKNQLQEDIKYEKININEYNNSFRKM